MDTPAGAPSPLTLAAIDTERHVARAGWDQPPRLFALVRTERVAEHEPELVRSFREEERGAFTSVEQEGLPPTSDLQSMLARIAWPPEVDGVALAVERIVVPPEAERDLPESPGDAVEALASHPARKDVRLLSAVLRSGESVTLLRQRTHDSDDAVAVGQDIAPGLEQALRATLED